MIFLLLLLLLHFANIWREFPLSILLTPAVAVRNKLVKRSVISRLDVFVWLTGYVRGNTINTRIHRRINIRSTLCKNQRKWCQVTFPQINTAVTHFWKKLRRSSLFIRGSASIKLGKTYQQENWPPCCLASTYQRGEVRWGPILVTNHYWYTNQKQYGTWIFWWKSAVKITA